MTELKQAGLFKLTATIYLYKVRT